MKKFLFFCFLSTTLAYNLSAQFGFHYSNQLYRVPNIRNLGDNNDNIDLVFFWSKQTYTDSFPSVSDTNAYYKSTSELQIGSVQLGYTYGLSDNDDIGIGIQWYFDFYNGSNFEDRPYNAGLIEYNNIEQFRFLGRNKINSTGFGDINLFYKRGLIHNKNFYFGALTEFIIPTGAGRKDVFNRVISFVSGQEDNENKNYYNSVFRDFKYGPGGKFTLMTSIVPVYNYPLSFYCAVGYSYLGEQKAHQMNFGVGSEFNLLSLKDSPLFVEFSGIKNLNSNVFNDVYNFTSGIRLYNLGSENMYLDFGFNLRLNNIESQDINNWASNPKWGVVVGLGYQGPYTPPELRYTSIQGRVIDAETEQGISGCIVSFNKDYLQTVRTDVNGYWFIDGVQVPTTLFIEASITGYESSTSMISLKPGDYIDDFTLVLQQEQQYREIEGNVYTVESEGEYLPVRAQIKITGDTTLTFYTDNNGYYKIKLPLGYYYVEEYVPGYLPQRREINLDQETEIRTNFYLIQERAELVFHNIHFEVDKAELLPQSYPVLDELAEILKDNPDVVIEIQGHTDSDASRTYNQNLSEARANTVKNYLINTHGINSSRLIAVGYGEDKLLISPERNEQDKLMNRRVEFHVIEN